MSGGLNLGMLGGPRVRLVRQSEMAECGLACLAMVGSYYGYDVDIASMRRRFTPSQRGLTMKSLIAIADQIGFVSRAVRLPLGKLTELTLPAVLHWDMNHFVVLERVQSGKALIHNPDGQSSWIKLEDVSLHFTGVALELRPGAEFTPQDERASLKPSFLWSRIVGLKRSIVQVIVLSLVLQLYTIALPYYTQVAIDTAVPAHDRNLLTVLALGFGLFTLVNIGASLLRSFVLLAAGAAAGFGVSTNIARRLFRLPIDWFEKRSVGDVLSRFQSVTPIQKLLTEGAVAALVDGCLAIVTLAVMFFYSAILASITITALLIYVAFRAIVFNWQRAAQESSIINKGKEQTVLIETIRGMTTLRLFGREAQRHGVWQEKLASAVNADIEVGRVNVWWKTVSLGVFGLENIFTIWIAVSFVIAGGFSVGMVVAYLSYRTQFMDKATSLIEQWVSFRMINLHLERLSDIAMAAEDRSFGESVHAETQLTGKIECRDVYFRYTPSDPFVLQGLNLTVERGEHIAITGPSGGGKSTLVKLLLGLAEPVAGTILVDGIPLERFGYQSYHRQIAAVLQDDSLFAGSIAENIALFDEVPDQEAIVAAARAASIDADIRQMPMQYETLIGDMGSALSGGQKQRVLLARALYRKPSLLIMDEGTAHLDAAHEAAVNKAIAAAGITRIIIAHRAETLANADRVLFLANGELLDSAGFGARAPAAG